MAAATGLLLALALLPVSARADEEYEARLPFLLANGSRRAEPPVAPVLLPTWAPTKELVEGRAYPDVSALLRGVPGASQPEEGRIALTGKAAEKRRLMRLLGAVHAGFGRRVRIEVEVRMRSMKEPIALSGEAPMGSLLAADARECRDYPAGLHLDSTSACAEMMCARVGPRLVASAVRCGEGFVLRLAVHISSVAEELRFEAERLTLVAPALAFSSLVAEVPANEGKCETIRCGDLTITYRVTPLPSPPSPAGTRVLFLDATLPLFAEGFLPVPGLVRRDDAEDQAGPALPNEPLAATGGADAGVRRYDVPPGLVVMEGDEAALEATAKRWRAELGARRAPLRLALVSDTGLPIDISLVPPARLVVVTGRIDPVVGGVETAVAESAAESGWRLDELFTGHTLTVSFEDALPPRLTEVRAAPTEVRRRVIPIVVQRQGITSRDELPGSAWAPTIARTSRLCRPDEIRTWRWEP